MSRLLRWSVPLGLLALVGCDGSLQAPPPAAPASQSPPTGADNGPGVAHGGRKSMSKDGGQEPLKQVTPVREIDANKVAEGVGAEVKGGEADKGPTPESSLWLYPDPKLVQDEPLNVEPPVGLSALYPGAIVPLSNPLTKAKFELGKQLYFEPRLSKDGTVSCATCHNPEKGWTDQLPTSVGILGQKGDRNAPTVLNTAYGRSMFWDGRAPSLEGQAQGPIQNKIEMGDQSYDEIIKRLREIPGYRDQFQKVFGTDVTLDGLAKAIATFERGAALSGNSAFDKYNNGRDNKALTESQKRGLVLFGLRLNDDDDYKPTVVARKANCAACHVGANFTDEQFHNLGIGWDPEKKAFKDLGRITVTPVGSKNLADLGAFKTPTLRDIEKTAPYLHDGSEGTLEAVIDFYDKGGNANPALDKDMKKLNLTKEEKADLINFMKALTGEPIKVALPELPMGPDGKSPDPKAALTPPSKKVGMAKGNALTR